MTTTSLILDGASYEDRRNESDRGRSPTLRVFDRAVVLHTLNDPSLRDQQADSEILEKVKNKEDYFRAPRNSTICRIITDQRGKAENSDYVCFPFFSSHLMMPVKAGEHVWILKEQPHAFAERLYWISRIPEPIDVEDANYTHSDRRLQYYYEKNANDPDDGSGNYGQSGSRKLAFPNGSAVIETNTTLSGDLAAYMPILTGSKESELFTFEPVPRYTKRPGDLVIQGSNNSSITLGTSFGWGSERPSVNTNRSAAAGANLISSSSLKNNDRGAIDIVTGRGRIFQGLDAESQKSKSSSTQNSTRPLVVQNEFGFEVDKNVATQQKNQQEQNPFLGKTNAKLNPQEGNPDFLLDASRIFLATDADVDAAFGTGPDGVASKFSSPAVMNQQGPAIAVKSDHVRIIARKTKISKNSGLEPNDIIDTNGSIRIIKEGEKNSDLATITIEPDGTIQISGSKIFLGRTSGEGGQGLTGPGDGGTHPYVKYQDLESVWFETMDAIDSFCTTLQAHFCPVTGPAPQINQAALDLQVKVKKLRGKIVNVKSTRIFGE